MVHSFEEFVSMKITGSNSKSISRGYMGIVVNSNFSQSDEILTIDTSLEKVLGEYLPLSAVFSLTMIKFRNSIKNRFLRRK